MIAIDVGNSRVKFGVFLETLNLQEPQRLPECRDVIAVPLSTALIPWEVIKARFGQVLSQEIKPQVVLAASVNSKGLDRILEEWPDSDWPRPRIVANRDLPITNLTIYPDRVGTDRLLKAVAANRLRPAGRPVIVVDSGTATTVDWITEKGEFAGGAIFPGVELSSRALHLYTDQLPSIDVEDLQEPPQPVGRETRTALQSGLFWGHIGAVRELIQRMSAGHALPKPDVIVTGGGGQQLALHLESATYRPALTLEGLAVTQGSFELS